MKHFFSTAPTIFGLLFFGIVALLIGVDITLAADVPKYTPLVGIPGLTDGGTQSLPTYINSIYLLTITIGALFGVVKIAIAGVKYSMTDVVSGKSSAKDDIKNVLLGLAVLLIPFMVLNTINPELTKLDVLKNAPKVKLTAPSAKSPKTFSGTTLNNADGTKNTEIQKTGAAPAGTKRDTCSYQPQRGAGGCWTEAQQNSSQCQAQKIACLDACASKSGTYQNVETGDNTGNIICTYPG